MRWYQHLFWRIFGAVWLVSSLGIVISVSLFLAVVESRNLTERQETRVSAMAEQIIHNHNMGIDTPLKRRHRTPIWIYPDGHNEPLYTADRQVPDNALELTLTESGSDYRVVYLPDRDVRLLDRLGGFWLSFQAIWVFFISLFSSALVTWIVVRPIRDLTVFIRRLHHQGSFSNRADGRLVERKDELGELAREFNQMVDFAEQTLMTQRHLLQDVSHELRAPLARIQAAAGLAEQQWGEDDRSVKRIHTECMNLDTLITEILNLARAGQDDSSSPLSAVADLLTTQIENATLLGTEHHFILDASSVPIQTQLHAEPFGRIVNNVLNNAVNHTPKGTEVRVSASVFADALHLSVRDNGPGVPDMTLDRLGRPFSRGEASSGFGLGLSIVKREIDRVGGTVTFSNHDSGGFVVNIKMPLVNNQ